MKRQWKVTLALICCFVLLAAVFAACTVTVKVTFDPNYTGAKTQVQTLNRGAKITPPTVTRTGFKFDGWYWDDECTDPVLEDEWVATINVTFYAHWTPTSGDSGDGDVADMSIHFIDLGTNSGDCIYIKAGDTDILIDAGAVGNSANTIRNYVKKYCTDGILEYVIATHADSDHIAAFVGTTTQAGILDTYQCENIIRFAKTNKSTQVVTNFLAKCEEQKANGANYYTALECYNNENGAQRTYEIASGITMEVLYQEYYQKSHSKENNYSVCLLFTQGENHYLFTGDAEQPGETSLVNSNPDLPEVVLYKAGHHGSDTSSNEILLSKIRPQYVVACCAAGDSYKFPTQGFIDRIASYTDKVYVTGMCSTGYGTMNGNIVFSCKNDVITIECSLNDTLLKDTAWFAGERTMPDAWK